MPDPQLGPDWSWIERMGERKLALPDSPERLELGAGAGECQLLLADEFGEAFGVLHGSREHLALALARALDQLYGVEWGTVEAPRIDATSERAELEAFGERYVAVWRRPMSTALLFAVAKPEREARALAFVAGASMRG